MARKNGKSRRKRYTAPHGWWMAYSPLRMRWIIAHRDGRAHLETHETKSEALRRWNHITGRSDT